MLFHLYLPRMLTISNERIVNDELMANLTLINSHSFFNSWNALIRPTFLYPTRSDVTILVNDSHSEDKNAFRE